jgi:ABC-2 type transport system ATP-binding protein
LLLQVVNLTKRYGHLTALSEVSFSIRQGEVLGLIGPNGSGKTTLFECLGNVLPADGGSVLREGGPLTPAERKAAIFYLPDAIAPWPAQTVRWALEFMRGFFGVGPRHEDDRGLTPIRDVIHELELEPLLDSPIGTLSKGQRKRMLLALGLLAPQPILLADEPFEGLDLRQTRAVASTLRAHAGGGRTLFLSIHQINDAARVCDRFVLLSNGRVGGEGTGDELSLAAASRGASAADLEGVFLALT